MVLYDDLLFVQILTQVEYEVGITEYEFNKLLKEVEKCNKEGISIFEKHRELKNLDFLLYSYFSAKKGKDETCGITRALGTYIKGIFQSKMNHKALLKGINLTSVNRVPLNASLLVQQAEAVIEFDDECEMLYQAIVDADVNDYTKEVGATHQKLMAKNREKVKQYSKKYIKK